MSEKKKQIYVVGHNDPDTGSVCCSAALANLQNRIQDRIKAENLYTAVCPGSLQQQTKEIFELFHTPLPQIMTDARTQTTDVDYSEGISVREDISLLEAWKLMRKECRSTLAVTRQDGTLHGVITTGDIAKSYMEAFDNKILAQAHTPFRNIVETLNGEQLTGDPQGEVSGGKVSIAAANTDIIRERINPGDVLLLANRYEAQVCSIEQQAAVMIVCAGTEVSRTILKLAQEKKCTVITTPFDTYAAARMINLSIPVRQFMTTDPVHFQEDDYIDDIRPVMMGTRIRDFPILTADGKYIGMISRRHLIDMKRKQFLLVDHNDAASSIRGIEEAEVVGIVDNHSLKTVQTVRPVPIKTCPVGSCAFIIARMFAEDHLEIDPDTAGLLYAALLYETKGLTASSVTKADIDAAGELAGICGDDLTLSVKNILGLTDYTAEGGLN